MANKSEVIYDVPIRLQCIAENSNGKYLRVGKQYKCIGEFHQSNGGILYSVIDETKFEQFHRKDKFMVIGNCDKVDIDIVESEK